MNLTRKALFGLVMAGLLLGSVRGGASAAPGVDAWPTSKGERVEIRTEVRVYNFTNEPVRDLVLTLPPTVADRIGEQRVLRVSFGQAPAAERSGATGIEVTYRLPEVSPGETILLEQTYLVAREAPPASAVSRGVATTYLGAEEGIEVDHPSIRALATFVIDGVAGPDEQASALLQAVVDRLAYDPASGARNMGALAGLTSGTGVCQEYASLFVALSRAAGIPARLVYGWAQPAGPLERLSGENRHVWAEYFHPERGWVSVDPTFAEGQKDLLYFDPALHIAQAYQNSSLTASFEGDGLVGIRIEQYLRPVERVAHP